MATATPTTLRRESFAGAEGLQEPLNDLLTALQQRIALLEARRDFAVLGPRPVTLPIDESSDRASVVAFALPPDFVPGVPFVLGFEAFDSPGVPTINPLGVEFRIDDGRVLVTRLTTVTSTAYTYNLTLGVTRGA
jgi:hypothetical protein